MKNFNFFSSPLFNTNGSVTFLGAACPSQEHLLVADIQGLNFTANKKTKKTKKYHTKETKKEFYLLSSIKPDQEGTLQVYSSSYVKNK